MVRKKLAGYTPSEAILIMNAWPATTRRAGAALSDFLTETRATMEYTAGSPRSRLPATTKLVITFIYRDITGDPDRRVNPPSNTNGLTRKPSQRTVWQEKAKKTGHRH